MLYFYLGITFTTILWTLLKLPNLSKSTLHALIALYLSYTCYYDLQLTSMISIGYYIDDLSYTRKPIYIIHHIYSIFQCYMLLSSPYTDHNILHKMMLVELSVPFLNLYIYVKNYKYKYYCLIIYLIMHVGVRNLLLLYYYNTLIPVLVNDGIPKTQVFMYEMFMVINFYWTYKTYKKLKKLKRKINK